MQMHGQPQLQSLTKGRTQHDPPLSGLKIVAEMHSTDRSPWATKKGTDYQMLATFILSKLTT